MRAMTFLHNGVTAHCGHSSAYPENTITAFRSALELGVDWIELDIRQTNDGQVVVLHDPSTERVATVNLTVSAVTYQELQSVDVD